MVRDQEQQPHHIRVADLNRPPPPGLPRWNQVFALLKSSQARFWKRAGRRQSSAETREPPGQARWGCMVQDLLSVRRRDRNDHLTRANNSVVQNVASLDVVQHRHRRMLG